MSRILIFAAALAALPASALAARPITLDEALQLAESKSPELAAADDARQAARQDLWSARGDQLPQFKVTGSALDWDSHYLVNFGAPILIREQQTTTLDVTGYQPITGLFPLHERDVAAKAVAGAAEADVGSTRAEVRVRTTAAYLRLLEAIDLARIASGAVKDIEEQRRIASSLVQAGTLIQLDLTRTEVALADAKQRELHANAAVGMSAAALDAIMGLPPTTELAPVAPDESHLPEVPASVDGALEQAAKHRPEIAAARERARAASAGHLAAIGGALPQIGVIAQYENLGGIKFGQPHVSEFVGGSLSWTFWDWGHQFHDAKAAGYRAKAAQSMASARERDVELEVTTTYLNAQAAYAAVDVAHAAVGQAEEAYRVTRSLYENGNANTTDVLDAELALARARSNDASTRYDYRIAYAAFARAAALDEK